MEAIVRDLLGEVREFLEDRLDEEIDSNSIPGCKTRATKKLTMDANALEDIAPLEEFIARINEVLADNRGGGI